MSFHLFEELRLSEFDVLHELRYHNGQPYGDALVRARKKGDAEDGRLGEKLLALDIDELLCLCTRCDHARCDLRERH